MGYSQRYDNVPRSYIQRSDKRLDVDRVGHSQWYHNVHRPYNERSSKRECIDRLGYEDHEMLYMRRWDHHSAIPDYVYHAWSGDDSDTQLFIDDSAGKRNDTSRADH